MIKVSPKTKKRKCRFRNSCGYLENTCPAFNTKIFYERQKSEIFFKEIVRLLGIFKIIQRSLYDFIH